MKRILLTAFSVIIVSFIIAQIPAELVPELYNDNGCSNIGDRSNSRRIELVPFFLPNENDNILYIHINLLFMQKDDGSGNFHENNSEEMDLIDDAIDFLNYKYSHLILPDSVSCYDGPTQNMIYDSKIQFIPHKYFIKHTNLWDNHHDIVLENPPLNSTNYPNLCPDINSWYLDSFDYSVVNDSAFRRGINVYFTEAPLLYHMCWELNEYDTTIYKNFPGAKGACANFPCDTLLSRTSRVHMIEQYSKYWWMKNIVPTLPKYNQPWIPTVREWMYQTIGQTLAHELGHTLYLYHPIDDGDLCYFHHNCYYAIMNPSGTTPHNFLHPMEIGLSYVSAMCTNIQTFIDEDTYLGTKNINNATLSLPPMRLYHSLVIGANADISMLNDVFMPEQSSIEVYGTLRLNGGSIKSITGNKTQGLVVKAGGSLIISDSTDISDYNILVEADGSIVLISNISVSGDTYIKVKKEGCICINPNVTINLVDGFSRLDISNGACFCNCTSELYSCASSLSPINVIGEGTIINKSGNNYIQNEIISSETISSGNSIFAGEHVTTTMPIGEVVVEDGGNLRILYNNQVVLDAGFSVEEGGQLQIQTQ